MSVDQVDQTPMTARRAMEERRARQIANPPTSSPVPTSATVRTADAPAGLVVPNAEDRKLIGQFFAALAKAQSEVKQITKDSTNEYDRYKYTSMDSFTDACRPPLNANGFAILAPTEHIQYDANERPFRLDTEYVLGHSSGLMMQIHTEMPIVLNPKRPTSQDKPKGAASTYSQGFTLRGVLCAARSDGEPDNRGDSGDNGRPSADIESQRKRNEAEEGARKEAEKKKAARDEKRAAEKTDMDAAKARLVVAFKRLGKEKCAAITRDNPKRTLEQREEAATLLEAAMVYEAALVGCRQMLSSHEIAELIPDEPTDVAGYGLAARMLDAAAKAGA